jgi:hypothetical protein
VSTAEFRDSVKFFIYDTARILLSYGFICSSCGNIRGKQQVHKYRIIGLYIYIHIHKGKGTRNRLESPEDVEV